MAPERQRQPACSVASDGPRHGQRVPFEKRANARDDGCVGDDRSPAWVAAATQGAERLAAEAGAEADEALADPGAGPAEARRLGRHVARLVHSARRTEVAGDLAALLWAECRDVPRIASILDEPEAQAALEAVSEARRRAGRRVAEGIAPCARPEVWPPLPAIGPGRPTARPAGLVPAGAGRPPAPPAAAGGARTHRQRRVGPHPVGAVPLISGGERRPAARAAVAGAAVTAVLLFGRHVRRA